MLGQGGSANPKLFQLDDYKKSLLLVLVKLYMGCTEKEVKVHNLNDILRDLNRDRKEIDMKELTRLLYILEGWELCSPVPETNLTSMKWKLTAKGHQMVKSMYKSLKLSLKSVF